jgi:hypothetical protein
LGIPARPITELEMSNEHRDAEHERDTYGDYDKKEFAHRN